MAVADIAPLVVAYLRKRRLTKTLKAFIAETSYKDPGEVLEEDLEAIYGSYLLTKAVPKKRNTQSDASEPVENKSKVRSKSPFLSNSTSKEEGKPLKLVRKIPVKVGLKAANCESETVVVRPVHASRDESSSDDSFSGEKVKAQVTVSTNKAFSSVDGREDEAVGEPDKKRVHTAVNNEPAEKESPAIVNMKPATPSSSGNSDSSSEEEGPSAKVSAKIPEKTMSKASNVQSKRISAATGVSNVEPAKKRVLAVSKKRVHTAVSNEPAGKESPAIVNMKPATPSSSENSDSSSEEEGPSAKVSAKIPEKTMSKASNVLSKPISAATVVPNVEPAKKRVLAVSKKRARTAVNNEPAEKESPAIVNMKPATPSSSENSDSSSEEEGPSAKVSAKIPEKTMSKASIVLSKPISAATVVSNVEPAKKRVLDVSKKRVRTAVSNEPAEKESPAIVNMKSATPSSSGNSDSSSEEEGPSAKVSAKIPEKTMSKASNVLSKPISAATGVSNVEPAKKRVLAVSKKRVRTAVNNEPAEKESPAIVNMKPATPSSSGNSDSSSEEEGPSAKISAKIPEKTMSKASNVLFKPISAATVVSNVEPAKKRVLGVSQIEPFKKEVLAVSKTESSVKTFPTISKVKPTSPSSSKDSDSSNEGEGKSLQVVLTKIPGKVLSKAPSVLSKQVGMKPSLDVTSVSSSDDSDSEEVPTKKNQSVVPSKKESTPMTQLSSEESDSSSQYEAEPVKVPGKVGLKVNGSKHVSLISFEKSSSKEAKPMKITVKIPERARLQKDESKQASTSSEDLGSSSDEEAKPVNIIAKVPEKVKAASPDAQEVAVKTLAAACDQSSSDDSDSLKEAPIKKTHVKVSLKDISSSSEESEQAVEPAEKRVTSRLPSSRGEMKKMASRINARVLGKETNGESKKVVVKQVPASYGDSSSNDSDSPEKVLTMKTGVKVPLKEVVSPKEREDELMLDPAEKQAPPVIPPKHFDLAAKESSKKKRKRETDQQDKVERNSRPRNGTTKMGSTDDRNGTSITEDKTGPDGKKQLTNHFGKEGSGKFFRKIDIQKVKYADPRLQDNSYWSKNGAEGGWGAKAEEILGQVKGKGFRHEKTKKKRGSYKGGAIDFNSHSIKFKDSDEE